MAHFEYKSSMKPDLTPADRQRRNEEILRNEIVRDHNPAFIYGFECGFEYATKYERNINSLREAEIDELRAEIVKLRKMNQMAADNLSNILEQ